jgi:hypothetical protein
MRRTMFVVACVAVMGLGLTTHSVSAYKATQDVKQWPARRVCITYLSSVVDPQGRETFTAIKWHYTDSADASRFKWTQKQIGRASSVVLARDGEGLVAEVDGKETVRLSECIEALQVGSQSEVRETEDSRRSHTAEYFLASPTFTRTDTVAGFPVFVWRRYGDDGGWGESSYSPQVGATALSMTIHTPDGSETRSLAIKVEFL